MARSSFETGKRVPIDALADLDRAELVNRWHDIYGVVPPKGIERGLLERAIAYHLQTRPGERLQPLVRKQLLRIAGGEPEPVIARETSDLKPGARLFREWHGITHQVDVIDAGFVWQGEMFKTLSSVAGAITGAHWSGPRFFGLCASETSPSVAERKNGGGRSLTDLVLGRRFPVNRRNVGKITESPPNFP